MVGEYFPSVGGYGGDGGNGSWADPATMVGNIYVYGGDGGRGGQGAATNGGNGGHGGSASLTLSAGSVSADKVYMGGGGGANGGSSTGGYGTTGTGGRGGDARLTVTGDLNAATSISVYSGNVGLGDGYGTGNPGAGGDTAFTVGGTLTAPSIDLFKNDGNLAVNIATLDATNGDTIISLGHTSATTTAPTLGEDGVYIGTARLGNGLLQTELSFPDSGTAYINTLKLEGSGIFNDTANPLSLGQLEIDGGTLNSANWSGLIDHPYAITSDITLGTGGATVDLGAGESKNLSRVLTGSGSLTKSGAGTLILSGTNTYSGATTISDGTLSIGSDSNIGSGTNTLNGGTLLLTGPSYRAKTGRSAREATSLTITAAP
jgi:autotransporter-associated beta strand protein